MMEEERKKSKQNPLENIRLEMSYNRSRSKQHKQAAMAKDSCSILMLSQKYKS